MSLKDDAFSLGRQQGFIEAAELFEDVRMNGLQSDFDHMAMGVRGLRILAETFKQAQAKKVGA